MNLNKIALLAISGVFAFLTSCATKPPIEPTVSKTEETYVNPYEPGSYEHFKAEKSYPKTKKVWTNVQLLPETDQSNSWLDIDLKTQRSKLMKGEEVVMDYPISSGTKSRPTPPGEYKILEKIIDKRSNLYGKILNSSGSVVKSDADSRTDTVPAGGKFQGAPMKYWMRLTKRRRRPSHRQSARLPRITRLHPWAVANHACRLLQDEGRLPSRGEIV